MSELTTTSYFQLISDFQSQRSAQASASSLDKETGVLEFTSGNLMIYLVPHTVGSQENPDPDAIVLEADLMLLNLKNTEVNHRRFLLLHQLNAVSRLTTGIIAFISEEGMLSISKIIPLADLTPEQLTSEVEGLIQSGNDLYEGWNALADLDEEEKAQAEKAKIERAEAIYA